MQTKLTFNKFATTLAALGATTLTVSATAVSPVHAAEIAATQSVGDDATVLADEDDDKKKKKKKKDDGDEGGCGAGSCG